jgi:hypothetical protein
MLWRVSALALAGCLAFAAAPGAAVAQQWGGVLKFFHRDSPASMSIHEEATISTVAGRSVAANAGRETPSRSDDPAPRSGTPSTGGTPLEAHRQEKSMS